MTPAARRAVLIVNPAARRARRAEARALGAFARAGVACEVRRTERAGHAAELAAALGADRSGAGRSGADLLGGAVFVLGGDGTAMEVVGALAGTGVPVGIVPGGTGNLVARMLGTPLDPARAVPALLAGAAARFDLGRVRAAGAPGAALGAPPGGALGTPLGGGPGGWRHFAFSAGVGIDAHMIERTPAAWKRRLGVLAYAAVAARAALAGRTFSARVLVDGWAWEGEASSVMVANFGAVLGGRFHFGPGIRADDGVLDLCVLAPRTRADAVRALARLAAGDFRPDPALVYRAGREFRVETAPARTAQADGELLGATPFVVHTVPRAATLLVPAGAR